MYDTNLELQGDLETVYSNRKILQWEKLRPKEFKRPAEQQKQSHVSWLHVWLYRFTLYKPQTYIDSNLLYGHRW